MAEASRFRDAARIHVDAPPERVREMLENPDVLRALDERLAEGDVEVTSSEDSVEVHGDGERLHVAFRLAPDGDGTKVAALENVEPEGLVERTKWMLFPQRAHEEFEAELERLRHLAEAFDAEHGA